MTLLDIRKLSDFPCNVGYTLRYTNAKGEIVNADRKVEEEPVQVRLYMGVE